MQELADVMRDPGCALFQQVPEDSGLYQPSEKAHIQADAVDVVSVFRSLGIVVAKAVISRACFPLRFTQCASGPNSVKLWFLCNNKPIPGSCHHDRLSHAGLS